MKYGYSIRAIVKFAIPMILNSLVMNIMFIADRIILARYSLDSMNSASLGGNFAAIAFFCGVGVTETASVFVGQYNGLKEYHNIGRPVWQMIYFSLALIFLFVPAGLYCEYFGLFPAVYHDEGIAYLKPLLIGGWIPALVASFVSFFVGRGKSLVVILVFFLGNIINIVCNIALVFGVPGIIPEMGIRGSAYATLTGEIFFALVFGILFLREKNRKHFGTGKYKFMPQLMWDCIKIGVPISTGKIFSQVGWFVMMFCFSFASKEIATCESFAVVIWTLFIVFSDGLSRSLTALSSNLIGRNQMLQIKNLLNLFLNFNYMLFAIFSIPLVFYQQPVLDFAIKLNSELASLTGEMSFLMISLWFVLLLDGVYYSICAVLNSGGDTKFPMFLEFTTLWIGAVIPICVLCYTGNLTSIRIAYTLLPLTQIVNVTVIYRRYKANLWFHKVV